MGSVHYAVFYIENQFMISKFFVLFYFISLRYKGRVSYCRPVMPRYVDFSEGEKPDYL